MLVTLAFIILGSAIVLFFLQEFMRLFKKLGAIPGVRLLFPLALASWLIETYDDWGYWMLIKSQATLHQLVHQLATVLPFERGAISIVRIVVLVVLAGLPIWFFQLRASKRRGSRNPQPFVYGMGLILWIFGAILLTVTL